MGRIIVLGGASADPTSSEGRLVIPFNFYHIVGGSVGRDFPPEELRAISRHLEGINEILLATSRPQDVRVHCLDGIHFPYSFDLERPQSPESVRVSELTVLDQTTIRPFATYYGNI